MHDLTHLIPLVIGGGILLLGMKTQLPKGPEINRPLLGLTFVASSLFFWLSTAMLLMGDGAFNFMINLLTVALFSLGLALFVPPPPGATRVDQHRLPAKILAWIGLLLGLVHSIALLCTKTWPALLIELYTAIGL